MHRHQFDWQPHSSYCYGMMRIFHESPSHISFHYNDVIMGAVASQITSLTIVYWTVHSDTNQRKHQSSASLALAGLNNSKENQVELLQRNYIENTFIWRPGTYHRLCINDDLYIGLDTHTNCILTYDVDFSQTDGVCHLFLFCFVLTDGERMAYAGLPSPCTGWSVPDVVNIYLI